MKLAISLAAVFALSACSGNGGGDNGACNAFISAFTVKDQMGQSLSIFTTGQAITFETQVTNTTAEPQSLALNGGCSEIYVEVANSSNQVVWISSCAKPGHLCLCASDNSLYQAGETKTLTYNWNQQQTDGVQAPTGQYRADSRDGTTCSPTLDSSEAFIIQ